MSHREISSRHNTPMPLCEPGFKAVGREGSHVVRTYANTQEEAEERANEELDRLLAEDDDDD